MTSLAAALYPWSMHVCTLGLASFLLCLRVPGIATLDGFHAPTRKVSDMSKPFYALFKAREQV